MRKGSFSIQYLSSTAIILFEALVCAERCLNNYDSKRVYSHSTKSLLECQSHQTTLSLQQVAMKSIDTSD